MLEVVPCSLVETIHCCDHHEILFIYLFIIFCGGKGERERDIFISPWLQVRVTGPRHHLAGSLLTKRRGQDEKEICTWVTGMVV